METIFPKYKREEKRNVKLSLEEVDNLRADFKEQRFNSKTELGKEYGITLATVNYWLLSEEERAEYNKKRKTRKHTYNADVHRRYLDNKLESDRAGVREYRNAIRRKGTS